MSKPINSEPGSFGPAWDDPEPITFVPEPCDNILSVDEALEIALHCLNTLPNGWVYATSYKTSYEVASALEKVIAYRKDIIADEWTPEDVMEFEPSVSREEAVDVLKRVKANLDSERGINWSVIENTIGEMKKAG